MVVLDAGADDNAVGGLEPFSNVLDRHAAAHHYRPIGYHVFDGG